MKKMTWLILTLTLISTIFLAGCSSEDTASEYTNTLEQYQAEGIIIGTEGTYAPFTYVDENGELTGFDVEIITEIFTRMGIEVTFETSEWDGLIAGLDAGRWNVVANQISVTPEREDKYSFTDPYLTSSAVIITTSDNSDINSMEDLEGKKVAAATGSEYYKMAEEAGAEVVVCDGFAQAIELVKNGQVDATINDSLTYYDFMNKQPDTEVKIAYTSPETTEVAFMLPKGNDELIAEMNATLAEMKDDGTYDEIYNKYFGVPAE